MSKTGRKRGVIYGLIREYLRHHRIVTANNLTPALGRKQACYCLYQMMRCGELRVVRPGVGHRLRFGATPRPTVYAKNK